MSDSVIRVVNVSKCYRLSHQQEGRQYKALRDVMADGAQAISDRLRGRERVNDPKQEDFWALKDVSFEIKQGDRVGIIGRNGSGKSTLLKILSRIVEPTTGEIGIRGRVASLLEVGTGFHQELTGRENIFLNGAILGMSRAEITRKFDEIVDFAEVEKFLDTPVKRYSSGMYVRLAFSVAAHLEPEILIVDEVLAVGDVQFQKKCIGKMEEVGKEGRTLLFVSHTIGIIQALCTHGILLNQGRVVADDTAKRVVDKYLQTLETSATQNLLSRTDRQGKGLIRLASIEISTGGTSPSATLATGYPGVFAFHITETKPGLSCCFTIYDQYGQAVTYFDSSILSYEDETDPGTRKFVCVVDELLLLPGRYRINAALMCDGEFQDDIKAAALFEVQEGIMRGRPVSSESGYGNICIQHRWIAPA
jgi:lipopolysaccharide transport system ATP-binding protein